MNTIMKIAKLQVLSRRPTAAVFAMPRRTWAFNLPISEAARQWVAFAAIAVAIIAVISYVVAVNTILLSGEAIKRDRMTLNALQQEQAALSSMLVARESPASLEARARASGMVEVTGVRFLDSGGVVALFR